MDKIILCCIFLSLFVVGCTTYPTTKISAVDTRPTISFVGAPENSILFVDNLSMGSVSQYNGKPNVLKVEPGTHEIQIMQNNKIIFQQTVFVQSENKTISIH